MSCTRITSRRAGSCGLHANGERRPGNNIQARGELRRGPAAAAIIAAATEHEVDLIVMGMRGHGNLEQILGSVSTQVLRHARCPVLQIP